MSKSRGNTIDLKEPAESVAKKVRRMYAGPPRELDEPGDVAENPIFLYLDAFDPDRAEVANLKEAYERSGVANKILKERLTTALHALLDPIRERRAYYEAHMDLVRGALEAGSARERVLAQETLSLVRDALDLDYLAKYREPGARYGAK
jgi:tryptophanyl-tRNA synthetase